MQLGGKKYLRLVARRPGADSGSAWCFVDASTGDVLKCDSFKRPAKGVRGTVFSADWAGYGCTANGPEYLR